MPRICADSLPLFLAEDSVGLLLVKRTDGTHITIDQQRRECHQFQDIDQLRCLGILLDVQHLEITTMFLAYRAPHGFCLLAIAAIIDQD